MEAIVSIAAFSGAGMIVAGVTMLAGAAWGIIACGLCLCALALILARGLTADGQ